MGFNFAALGTAGANVTLTELMTISNTGNVGIGITGPTSNLHVTGNIRATTGINAATLNVTTANLTTLVGASDLIISTGSSSNGNIIFSANGAEDMRIVGLTGNIGIGTTSPINKLEVNGAIAITNTTGTVISTQYGNIYTTSAVTAYTVDTFASATFRSAKYFAQMEATTGPTYGVIELNLVHDGTTVYLSQYGETKSNASANLGVFDAVISAGALNLTYTPGSVYTAQTVKVVRLAVTD
jgi:hypothetical protein